MARDEFLGVLILAGFLSSSNWGVISWTQGGRCDVIFTGSKGSNSAQYETIPINTAVPAIGLFCYYDAQFRDDPTIVGDSGGAFLGSSDDYDHL